uniref:transcriptional regulator SUPERMAN-like n=1 Tax=Fragaria vesca subsp. vesca TaxID=101020 RepID=UPI0005C98206|nr:PREDICTED: transcriptional regulator SUPERMAN-like [Fragaria vesca subsp. vesca]
MSNKSDLSAAKTSRTYVCAFCSKTYPSSQALAGHSNIHRPWYLCREVFNIFAFADLDDSQGPLSPNPLNYRWPDDEPHVSRPFHSFRPTELYDRAPADPTAAESSTRRSGSGPISDQAGGSSHGCSLGENPKKYDA